MGKPLYYNKNTTFATQIFNNQTNPYVLQTYKPTNLQTYNKRTNFFTQLVAVLLIVSISGAGCNKKNDAKSSEAAITAFSFEKLTPVATGTISGGNISITVPGGTDVKSLIATFALSNGATAKVGDVLQVSGTTPNNFTSQVEYIVTAQDGITTNKFTVTVNIQTETSKEIKAFSFVGFESVMATITDTAITVALPAGTNVTALKANFATTGASVKIGDVLQVSGITPNDFTTPKTYTVTAQDNSTHNYTVTVTGPATTKEITAFSFDGLAFATTVTIDEVNHTIAVGVKAGTDVTKLVATFTTTGVSVKVVTTPQVSGTTPNDFTNPVTYIVTAQDGSTQNYTVTVTATATKYVTIPDANFRSMLKTGLASAFGTGADADKLNVYDNSVTSLPSIFIAHKSIADLTGIEYFVGLTGLTCYGNQLTSLDLSKNTNLKGLVCYENQLTSLDISSQKQLTTFFIYSTTPLEGENPLITLKVNILLKDNPEVKQAKTNNPSCVISTYTNSSADASPACANYDPNAGTCTP